MSKPPIIFSPRWFRLFFMILGEAELWPRFQCWIGWHHWIPETQEKGQHCDRTQFCRYHGMTWHG